MLAIVVMSGAPPVASAFVANGSGHWGSSTVPPFEASVHPFAEPFATVPARTVHTVPRYVGAQKITVFWSIYRWQGTTGSYASYYGTSSTVAVPQGGYATFQARQFNLDSFFAYTFELTTVWHTARGALIGVRRIHYVDPTDYRCYATGQTTCEVQTLGGRSAVYVTDL